MSDNEAEAQKFKAEGNALLSKKDFQGAIEQYTKAIELHKDAVFYSNRAAAFASLNDFDSSLKDAEEALVLKPDWNKALGRKALALLKLQKMQEAEEVCEHGLKLDPSNKVLQNVQNELSSVKSMGAGLLGMFQGDYMSSLRSDARTAAFCSDASFVTLMNSVATNPQALQQAMQSDPRMQQALMVLLEKQMGSIPRDEPDLTPEEREKEEREREARESVERREREEREKREAAERKAKEEAEKVPEQSEAEKKSAKLKSEGNVQYKAKNFEEALSLYAQAFEADNTNVACLSNKAAVYLEQKAYAKCIEQCQEAIEKGRSVRADYSLIAKLYERMGTAHERAGDTSDAVKCYEKALSEDRQKGILSKLRSAEKKLREETKKAYIDPEKAKAEKEAGNALFREHKHPEALARYEEAIKRDPSVATYHSNKGTCLSKLMAYPDAVKAFDEALALDPSFVKAVVRKGHCQFFMKDYKNSLASYEKALKMDETNQEAIDGFRRVQMAINERNAGMESTEEKEQAARAAQNDPEVQAILSDPIMRQVLSDMQADAAAAAKHMQNPLVREKIEKLVAAGILKVG